MDCTTTAVHLGISDPFKFSTSFWIETFSLTFSPDQLKPGKLLFEHSNFMLMFEQHKMNVERPLECQSTFFFSDTLWSLGRKGFKRESAACLCFARTFGMENISRCTSLPAKSFRFQTVWRPPLPVPILPTFLAKLNVSEHYIGILFASKPAVQIFARQAGTWWSGWVCLAPSGKTSYARCCRGRTSEICSVKLPGSLGVVII